MGESVHKRFSESFGVGAIARITNINTNIFFIESKWMNVIWRLLESGQR